MLAGYEAGYENEGASRNTKVAGRVLTVHAEDFRQGLKT